MSKLAGLSTYLVLQGSGSGLQCAPQSGLPSLIHNTRVTAFESPHPAPQAQRSHTDCLSPSASPRGSNNLIKFHQEKSHRTCQPPPAAVPSNKCSMAAIIFPWMCTVEWRPSHPLFTFESIFFFFFGGALHMFLSFFFFACYASYVFSRRVLIIPCQSR